MRNTTLAALGLVLGVLAGCDSSSPGVAPTTSSVTTTTGGANTTNASSANASTSTTSASAGSTSATNAGSTSGGATSGSTGGEPIVCTNSDPSTLPIDEGGWVASHCNSSGIQGAWYCYTDKIAPTDCVTGTIPYRTGVGMCITGQTQLDATFAAWGAGIGLSLNETGTAEGVASVKSAYNATSNGVAGFKLTITGSTGGQPIRIGFTPTGEESTLASPHWEVPGPGEHTVMIADAIVPASWDVENAGAYADPSSIYDLQIQVVGAEADAAYDFCVTNVTPVGADGGVIVGNTPSVYGGQLCGQYDTIDLGAAYTVQNNFWNQSLSQGSQCVTALWDNASTAGFVVSPSGISIAAETGPASYPSVVLGWHYGQFHGSYSAARSISSIATIPSTWSYSVPTGTESYNVSYDVWIHSNPNPGDPGGGLELMVWANHRDTTPIGSIVVPSIAIGGGTWEIWYGPNARGWNTVSYVNTSNPTAISIDLAPFITDAVTRGYASGSDYLLGVQAGFEIWRSSAQMTSNSYTISIN